MIFYFFLNSPSFFVFAVLFNYVLCIIIVGELRFQRHLRYPIIVFFFLVSRWQLFWVFFFFSSLFFVEKCLPVLWYVSFVVVSPVVFAECRYKESTVVAPFLSSIDLLSEPLACAHSRLSGPPLATLTRVYNRTYVQKVHASVDYRRIRSQEKVNREKETKKQRNKSTVPPLRSVCQAERLIVNTVGVK